MKKITTLVFTILLCIALLCACQPSNSTTHSGTDTATTVATTTTAATTTETTTTTAATENAYTINTDRLNEIGKTFTELQDLYGEPIRSRYESGGKIYFLQEAECAYFFGETKDNPFDESATCINILYLRANQLFNNLTEPMSQTDFAEMYNLEYLWSEQMKFYNDDYMSKFCYDNYEILIHATEDSMIAPDSVIEYIRPRNA